MSTTEKSLSATSLSLEELLGSTWTTQSGTTYALDHTTDTVTRTGSDGKVTQMHGLRGYVVEFCLPDEHAPLRGLRLVVRDAQSNRIAFVTSRVTNYPDDWCRFIASEGDVVEYFEIVYLHSSGEVRA